MTYRKISPGALQALKHALALIYWYKRDLRSFVTNAIGNVALVGQLNWADEPKIVLVSQLVDYLARNEDRCQEELLTLMAAVTDIEDLSHLEALDDGEVKSAKARKAVAALRRMVQPYKERLAEQEAGARRRQAIDAIQNSRGVFEQRLRSLRAELTSIISPAEPQRRGYMFQEFMRGLFEVFDLDPRASFRVLGEEIDGSFVLDGTNFLFEGRWSAKLVDRASLDAFEAKIRRRLDNTLGLFVSVNGFEPTAVELHSQGRPVIVLMNGADLTAVLENRIRLDDLLRRKCRRAADTGHIFASAAELV